MMTPRLNSDVKERICQVVHSHQAYVQGVGAMSSPHRMQFTGVNFILTHVDSEWRHIAIRYAWHTVHFDDCFPNIAFSEMQTLYGHHTRKICTTVRFRGIISHYRRYSMTEENEDLQPFCDLHKWPRLQELDITYAQKCAFPGLANYLEPRLANIRKITVRGRIPIDMRRAVMFLNSPKLEEIHICAFLREDDPISAITTRNDPILLMPIATGLSTIRLTTSIDIRIINAVLCAGRHQLLKVELIGLCPTQLIASGLSLASPTRKDASLSNTEEKDGRIWKSLAVLSIKLCTHTLHGTPARIYLDATEFPRLQCLKFTECSSLIPDSELPLNIAYGQSFSNKWPKLRYLCLLAVSDADSLSISENMPLLTRIDVHSTQRLNQSCVTTIRGVWRLLTSSLPLEIMQFTCIGEGDVPNNSERSIMEEQSALDFSNMHKDRPLRVLVAPHVRLTLQQITAIRQKCQNLSSISIDSRSNNAEDDSRLVSSCFRECSDSMTRLRNVSYLGSMATPPPYRRMIRIMNLWGGEH